MKPYSEDLLRRIIKAVQEGGISKSAAARLFDVSLSSVKRYVRIANRGASLEPRRREGGRPPKVDQTTEKLLEEDVHKRPAATVSERRHFLERLTGKSLGSSTVKRVLKRLGFSQKTGSRGDAGTGRVAESRLEGDVVTHEMEQSGWCSSTTRWAPTLHSHLCALGLAAWRVGTLCGAGSCALIDHRGGRAGLLRTLRLRRTGSTVTTDAVGADKLCKNPQE